jgi:hypothetical protein
MLAREDERQLRALVRAPEDAKSGSSKSPENAERSNLHQLLAMRLLGIARTALETR